MSYYTVANEVITEHPDPIKLKYIGKQYVDEKLYCRLWNIESDWHPRVGTTLSISGLVEIGLPAKLQKDELHV